MMEHVVHISLQLMDVMTGKAATMDFAASMIHWPDAVMLA
jgi:hypothetical protein